jgi:alpha-glucosidase (family GH31 glycosyl hydrolase)
MSIYSRRLGFLALSAVLAAWLGAYSQTAAAQVERFKFSSANNYLVVEFLDDDLVHFELSPLGPGPDTTEPIFTTPQVAKTDYPGPTSLAQSGPGGSTLDTTQMRIVVDPTTLCMGVTDKVRALALTTICPLHLSQEWKGLTIAPGAMQNVYGLGEQFITAGQANGDWTSANHQVRSPGDAFGNQMIGFNGGADGNAQFPIMYALGAGSKGYALFLDHIYKQRWDFSGNPWKVETWGDRIRGYLMTGADLPSLRQDYMELTGHPPVPPKKMLGLWVSEFGFDSWNELDDKLAALRSDKFPVDGFVLDLQWFGGVPAIGVNPSRMGSLSWDATRFPSPTQKLADYASQGIGIMTIEESFIDKGRPEHADLASREYLVKQCKNGPNGSCDPAQPCPAAACPPVFLSHNPWWGTGGMIDWTRDAAGDYWHDQKRQPLIDAGVIGHWIDLGEPETYGPKEGQPDWVAGVLPGKHSHADYHNLYNFEWAESIARGYARHNVVRRPFMMARSGAPGIQRLGASMWSGDIGSNLENLAAHMNAQMHMSLSGVDYFGADIGGFHRGALNGEDLGTVYTQWFADGMMLDIPGRPHTDNSHCPYPQSAPSGNCNETSPDRIGDKASNLASVRQRYALSPYLYALAYRAYLAGEPVAPPLVYYYQTDPNVRRLGSEKLLGRDLLVALVADRNAPRQLGVYLPAGDWIDYHTNEWLHSTGQTFAGRPLMRDGIFQLPLFARAGALIPKMYVDDKTMSVLGQRTDGSTRDELILRTYASPLPTRFTLYEDDGVTTAYQQGEIRKTTLSQQASGGTATVVIAPAQGTYAGAPSRRNTVLELVVEDARASAVSLNGTPLVRRASQEAFETADSGWHNAGNNLVLAKSGVMDVGESKTFEVNLEALPDRVSQTFVCRNGNTASGQSVYVVGNTPELGSWNPAEAVKLDPTAYPTWTGTIHNLAPETAIEWKCIKRPEGAPQPVDWEPGANNAFTSAASGSGGQTTGDFAGGTVTVSQNFVCDNGNTVWGQSVYVVGSVAALGAWNPSKAVNLDPTAYPRWTGTIGNLPPTTPIAWKCIKRVETGNTGKVDQWEPDPNNTFTSAASGSGGETFGSFQP